MALTNCMCMCVCCCKPCQLRLVAVLHTSNWFFTLFVVGHSSHRFMLYPTNSLTHSHPFHEITYTTSATQLYEIHNVALFPGIVSFIESRGCGRGLCSARQHSSYDDCLEVKRKYYQNCFVLDCVTQCSQSAAHLCEQFLQIKQIGFVTLGSLRCA